MTLDSRWTRTIDDALKDPRSSAYDPTIKSEVDSYNMRFAKTPHFTTLVPKFFKAMVLTESGGPAGPVWTTLPIQIGNHGDAGYDVLRNHEQNSDIIMDHQLQIDIATKPINDPFLNVRAGIAYVLTLAAQFGRVSQVDAVDPALRKHTVVKGDSFSRISGTEQTTVPDLTASNPGIPDTLKAGQKLNFHRAHMVTLISGWRSIDGEFVAKRYNVGDAAYAEKLAYCLERLP